VIEAVILDAGPLGLVTNPRRSPLNLQCARWVQSLFATGIRVVVPEIADYEVRRELLRANKQSGLGRLNTFITVAEYLPLNTSAMRQAAQFWATARQQGYPTAADPALDGDVILAAQAVALSRTSAVIATTNVGHLRRFAPAELWTDLDFD
jgi:predicted nucleic acid-binding protein